MAYDVSRGTVYAAGAPTPRELRARFADVINVQDFGARGDGVTDDTASIQAAINLAAATGREVFLPGRPFGKYYVVTRLFFYYDAVLNPGFPSTSAQSRGVTFRGAGPSSDVSASVITAHTKTTLVSTDATGPVLNVNGGAGFAARQVIVEDMSVVATNSEAVIRMVNANTGSELRRLMIVQGGTGGGIDWESVWVSGISDVIVQSASSSVTSGSYGVRIRAVTGGGEIWLNRVMVMRAYLAAGGFDIGIQLGALAGDDPMYDVNMTAIVCNNLTSQQVSRGLVLGGRVRGAVVNAPYFEQCATYAIRIGGRVSGLAIRGGYFRNPAATEAEIVVEGGPDLFNVNRAITIENNNFAQMLEYGIDFVDASSTKGRVVANRFVRYGAAAGTAIRTRGKVTPWAIEDNDYDPFTAGGVVPYDDTTGIAYRRETTGEVFIGDSLSVGGVKQSPGYQVITGTAGTVDVLPDTSFLDVTPNGSNNMTLKMPAIRETDGSIVDLVVRAGTRGISVAGSDGGIDIILTAGLETPGLYALQWFASAWHWVRTASATDGSPADIGTDRGDASVTLTAGSDATVQLWATALTANRVVTLATSHLRGPGARFRIVRTGLGAFTLDVGGLKTIPSGTAAFVDVMYDGSAWVLIGYGTL